MGCRRTLAIASDGAGQFAVLLHALCWVLSLRLIHKLIPLSAAHREDQARVRSEIWSLYAELKRYKRQPTAELLRVLERLDLPLHINGSESDIRDTVKKKKVSGTRSDLGQQCRDTFASLKKTCRKLRISFWAYLIDRVSRTNAIPPLAQLIEQRAASP